MFARMDIVAGTKNVLTVPRSAVVNCGSNNVAYVQNKSGMYEERPIKVGIQSGNLVEVVSGLSAGENVVIKGGFTLRACSLARTE